MANKTETTVRHHGSGSTSSSVGAWRGGGPQTRGTFSGVSITRIVVSRGLYWVPLIWGNCHVWVEAYLCKSGFRAYGLGQGLGAKHPWGEEIFPIQGWRAAGQ